MDKFSVTLKASEAGSIGVKYYLTRRYEIDAIDKKEAEDTARNLAYAENLEHTLITKTICTKE